MAATSIAAGATPAVVNGTTNAIATVDAAIKNINGKLVAEEPMAEYEGIYERFAGLLDEDKSLVDEAPMRLVADAFLIGKRITTDPFYD